MKKIKSMFENLGKNIILSLLFIVIFLNFNLEDISKVITGVVAICGIIIAYSYNNGAKNQREQQLLQNKREYYNKFVEAYINKINYTVTNNDNIKYSNQAIEAMSSYAMEISRLNTYASKNVMDFMNCEYKLSIILDKIEKDTNISIFYLIYGNDLVDKALEKYFSKKGISYLTELNDLHTAVINFSKTVVFLNNNPRYKQSILFLKEKHNNISDYKDLYEVFAIICNFLSTSLLLAIIREDLGLNPLDSIEVSPRISNSLIINEKIEKIYINKDLDEN